MDYQNVAFYSFIIDSLLMGILTVNPEMKVTSFNRWAERITGYSEKESGGFDRLRGHPPISYHKMNADAYKHAFARKMEHGR